MTHYTSLYGANLSMIQLIVELMGKGVDCFLMIPDNGPDGGTALKDELNRNGIPYIEAKIRQIKCASKCKVVLKYLYGIFLQHSIFRALEGADFDIVHSNSSVILAGSYLSKKLHARHVWHLREFGDLDYNYVTPFGKWYQKILYGGSNTFVAISKKIYDHYKPYVGSQRVKIIYNGIKTLPQRVVSNEEIVQFCIVGLLQKTKCQIDVVKAVDELVNNRNVRKFRVSIIGDGDPHYEKEIRDYISKSNISDYVAMMGRQDNVPDLLPDMDVGIMSSSNEAFGRVTVEYMMARLAVIASDGGANTEIISDGNTGLIYQSGNVVSLADKMEMMIIDREKLEKIALNGYNHSVKNFTSAANCDAIFNLYNELVARS